MQFHKQLILHDPENGKIGDCHRTALACLLNKKPEEVPHFGNFFFTPDKYFIEKDTYLKSLGVAEFNFPMFCDSVELLMQTIGSWNEGIYYLLSGRSKRGTNHIVVCKGKEFLHDPHPSNDYINEPCNDGYYWVSVLTPISGGL